MKFDGKQSAQQLYQNDRSVVAVKVNNVVKNLEYIPVENDVVEPITMLSKDGFDIITRTMVLVISLAIKRIDKNCDCSIEHFIGGGLYFEIIGDKFINKGFTELLKNEIKKVIDEDIKIHRNKLEYKEALKVFKENKLDWKRDLYDDLQFEKIDVYEADGQFFTFHGYLAPSTGYISDFDLVLYHPGIVVLLPDYKNAGKLPIFKEEKSLAKIFSKSKKWFELQNISNLSDLNKMILNGDAKHIVEISEAYFENRLSEAADKIIKDDELNLILIAGPSASGKTTTAHRLATQLAVRGKRASRISIDDYFNERDNTPLDKYGKPDYESIFAVDIDYLNEDILKLLDGKEVRLPRFNFHTGKREVSDNYVRLDQNHPIIMEGIHALNPILTRDIPNKNKFKIYISALIQLSMDRHNRIPTTDLRLMRRLIRDIKFRSNGIEDTFGLWESVKRGENKWIFPFQDTADFNLDSCLPYEINVYKHELLDYFKEVDQSKLCYKDIKKLEKFLKYFIEIDSRLVPNNSILREFIGE